MKHLVVGYGEVGKAVSRVLGSESEVVYFYDPVKGSDWDSIPVDVVHICIPYSEEFNTVVKSWMSKDSLTIVHSSVPVGTCDALGVVHSPIRGVHPNLEAGIRTFVKYFGGERADEAAGIFHNIGIKTKTYEKAKTTEALKLWDTTQYGKLIMMEKQIHEWCEKNDVDFDVVYTQANKDYNEGYTKLGMEHVVRPYLKHVEGKIGGHCVNENSLLLGVKL